MRETVSIEMEIMDNLNPQQIEAVNLIEGPCLILAGAGSGKTRVVTFRIANLIEMGIPASQILAVTFTNKAAGEMKERILHLTKSHVQISTFHSLGAKILRESIHHLSYKNDFTIYDEQDADKLLKTCIGEMGLEEKNIDLKSFRSLISSAKNELVDPESIDLSQLSAKAAKIFPQLCSLYQARLKEYNAVDFDDLLFLTVKLFKEHPHTLQHYQDRWSFLLIDEYQDTNAAQYAIVRMLVEKTHNLFVVGDPDQSIYSWRGANINNILNFENDYPGAKVIRLEQNYRSRTTILSAANALIGFNNKRYEKNLWSDRGPGEMPMHYQAGDERDEAEFTADRIRYHHEIQQVPLSHIAIFYRTNAQSRAFEDVMIAKRIPYIIIGGISFYQRREIKDILAFLRMAYSGSDFVSFTRTINLPKRGFGEVTIEKIRLGASQEGRAIFSYLEALTEGSELQHPIKLSSKQMEGLGNYVQVIRELKEIAKTSSLKELVKAAIERSKYLDYLKEDRETYDDRKGNLDELIAKAVEWEKLNENATLTSFLEELSLKSNLDEADNTKERVNLMTIHNGKGLEFTAVFLAGLEEDLFPHINSKDDPEKLEEERRLCYVGLTRAKEYLYLTYSSYRYMWGMARTQRRSRFLDEIPSEYIRKVRLQRGPRYEPVAKKKVDDEFIVDMDQTVSQEQEMDFVEDDTVFHREFGIGVIRQVYQGSAGLMYKVFFNKDNRERTIVAKYAKLNKL